MTAQNIPLFSVRGLAKLTGLDRDYLLKRIADASPAGTKAGHPTYALADVLPALCRPGAAVDGDTIDPAALCPADRKHYWDSQLKHLEYRQKAGELYERAEVMRTFTTAVAVFAEQMRTIPDLLERNAGLTPDQAVKAEEVINTQLAELKAKLLRTFGHDRD